MIVKLTKISTLSFIALIAMLLVLASPAQAETGITKIGQIGGLESPGIREAQDVAIDADNNIFVLDGNNKRVIKYDSQGNYVSQFGTEGTGDGEFGYSYGITTDLNGNIYVADTSNNRIQKFDNNGVFITKWGANGGDGSTGTSNGEFDSPRGIATDSSGNIFVADTGNGRVQKFDSEGDYLAQFACATQSVALDSSGNIFVADTGSGRVQKFDSTGTFVLQFGTHGSGDGEFYGLIDIAIDSDGSIFTVEEEGSRVQKFDSTGNYISQFGTSGSGDGQFDTARGIALDASNNIYIADTYNDRIQKFSNSGVYIFKVEGTLNNAILSYGLTAKNEGVYVSHLGQVGIGSNELRYYSASGNLLSSWDTSEESYRTYPYSLAVSSMHAYSLTYYEDQSAEGLKIKKTDLSGNFITEWEVPGIGFGIAIDSQENIYWANYEDQQIYKYSDDGVILKQFGSLGSGNGQFSFTGETPANNLGIDSEDNLYVADDGNHRIQKFDSEGNYLSQFGSSGSGDGQFGLTVYSPTIASNGDIYVGDFQQDVGDGFFRIQKFDSEGNYLSQYTQGPDQMTGELFAPYAVAAGMNGLLYVANATSYSIEILCDHDVSTNNCTGPSSGGGDSGQALTYPDPVKGRTVSLILPNDVTGATVAPVDSSSLPKDGDNQFPAGLTTFQFDTDPGATKTVSLYYDLPGNPTDYVARKYKTNTQTYLDVPNATITREDYNGKSMLKLTYDITDGGILDQDGQANGTVIDPVGLATTNLASTGDNLYLYLTLIATLILSGLGLALVRGRR